MAQRHTVYLKQSASRVTPTQLLKAIRSVEWDLVAEVCKVSRERINEADENMRIERVGTRGFRRYQLSYRPGAERPVDIERWPNADVIAGVLEEVIENLDPKKSSYERVQKHLSECVDIVSASYGSNLPGEAMAPILASQGCLWLAQQFDGLIRDPCGDWYAPTDGLDFEPL